MQQKPTSRLTAGGVMMAVALCLASVDRAAAIPEEPSTSTSAETKPTHIMNQEITNLLKDRPEWSEATYLTVYHTEVS